MVRKARLEDAAEISALIDEYAKRDEMLHRPLSEIYTHIRSFFVCEEDGQVVASCSLHICVDGLAEVRSLAVKEGAEGRGFGTGLVEASLAEARELDLKKVFALTYHPAFFHKFGFKDIDKEELPHKIWGECVKCAKFPNCDENAVIIELKG